MGNKIQKTSLVSKHILIVEDDAACQLLAELILEDIGCSFEVAVNGREAVNIVRSGKFDLVLMDLRMPVMNGYEATNLIREVYKDLPVIAVTAHSKAWDDGKCQECGMSDYLIKPFDRTQLAEKLLIWTASK